MTFLLIMLMVLDLFILLNGMTLTFFVLVNVWTSHWILSVVYLAWRIIYVYDSLMDINSNARLQVAIKPLLKLLPHVLNVIVYYEDHGDSKVNYRQWTLNGCKIFVNKNMSKWFLDLLLYLLHLILNNKNIVFIFASIKYLYTST